MSNFPSGGLRLPDSPRPCQDQDHWSWNTRRGVRNIETCVVNRDSINWMEGTDPSWRSLESSERRKLLGRAHIYFEQVALRHCIPKSDFRTPLDDAVEAVLLAYASCASQSCDDLSIARIPSQKEMSRWIFCVTREKWRKSLTRYIFCYKTIKSQSLAFLKAGQLDGGYNDSLHLYCPGTEPISTASIRCSSLTGSFASPVGRVPSA